MRGSIAFKSNEIVAAPSKGRRRNRVRVVDVARDDAIGLKTKLARSNG
jgi:hypothetical protein